MKVTLVGTRVKQLRRLNLSQSDGCRGFSEKAANDSGGSCTGGSARHVGGRHKGGSRRRNDGSRRRNGGSRKGNGRRSGVLRVEAIEEPTAMEEE